MVRRPPDPRQLSDLLEVSRTLGTTLNLRAALPRVLDMLEDGYGALSGTIVLRDDDAGDLAVAAASGAGTSAPARYRLGEGITGRVVQSGRPVVVPRACPSRPSSARWVPWAPLSPTAATAATSRR
jgi:Nif-specific regulatory protein